MLKIQIQLNNKAEEVWEKVSSREEFAMSTKSAVFYALMVRYLNPPTNYTTAVHKQPAEPVERVDAVAERKKRKAEEEQAAQDARIEIGLNKARAGLLRWPELEDFNPGHFCFPPEYNVRGYNSDGSPVEPWTPPDDYPQRLKDQWPAKQAKYEAYRIRQSNNTGDEIPEEWKYPTMHDFHVAMAAFREKNFGVPAAEYLAAHEDD